MLHVACCSYPPFAEDDQKKLFEVIKSGTYTFDPAEWGLISDGAKDLIRKILVTNPEKRVKASDILRHPWMLAEAASIPDVALSGTVEQMKRFNARRKLKKAIQGVRSTVRMKLLMAARAESKADAVATADSNPTVANVLYQATKAARAAEVRTAEIA
jgi:serine/threonine protein kinase